MKKFLFFIVIILLFTATKNKKQNYEEVLEQEIFKLINQIRKENNLPLLKKNFKLKKIAKAHSQDMAKRNYTSHITPEGLDPNKRAEKFGFNIIKKEKNKIRKGIGENIYETQSVMQIDNEIKPYLEKVKIVAQNAISSWMKSEGHRKNILNPDYKETGIGVAISNDKKIKITQLFF